MNNLKAIRQMKGISQLYISDSLNVSRQAIANWENGAKIPEKRLREICDILQVKPCEVLDEVNLKQVEIDFVKNEISRLHLRLKELTD